MHHVPLATTALDGLSRPSYPILEVDLAGLSPLEEHEGRDERPKPPSKTVKKDNTKKTEQLPISGILTRLRAFLISSEQSQVDRPQAMESIFMCYSPKNLRGDDGYAVRIRCSRPSRQVFKEYLKDKDGKPLKNDDGTPKTRKKYIERRAFESDSAIYEKLNAACYQHRGRWKRWIPFYGIVDVREVQVLFKSKSR
jgi:hypothetical protein